MVLIIPGKKSSVRGAAGLESFQGNHINLNSLKFRLYYSCTYYMWPHIHVVLHRYSSDEYAENQKVIVPSNSKSVDCVLLYSIIFTRGTFPTIFGIGGFGFFSNFPVHPSLLNDGGIL